MLRLHTETPNPYFSMSGEKELLAITAYAAGGAAHDEAVTAPLRKCGVLTAAGLAPPADSITAGLAGARRRVYMMTMSATDGRQCDAYIAPGAVTMVDYGTDEYTMCGLDHCELPIALLAYTALKPRPVEREDLGPLRAPIEFLDYLDAGKPHMIARVLRRTGMEYARERGGGILGGRHSTLSRAMVEGTWAITVGFLYEMVDGQWQQADSVLTLASPHTLYEIVRDQDGRRPFVRFDPITGRLVWMRLGQWLAPVG